MKSVAVIVLLEVLVVLDELDDELVALTEDMAYAPCRLFQATISRG